MKRFLIRVGLFGSLQLLIAGFVLMRGNPRDHNHFFCAMNDKIQRMEQVEAPRLLLVGGSNVAFGFNSPDFKETGYVPINLGLHVRLGLDFYLRIVEERVRSGDVIVVIPEYELLTTEVDLSLKRSAATVCPELAQYFDVPDSPRASWKHCLDHEALPTIHAWVHRAFKGPRDKNKTVYRRDAFNQYGDLVAHRTAPRPKADLSGPMIIDEDIVQRAIQRLNRFAQFCRERDAKVYFSYPPMPQFRYGQCEALLNKLVERLDRELHITQIGRPSDFVYENDQFFDTFYHLMGDAIANRTGFLCQFLELQQIADRTEKATTRR